MLTEEGRRPQKDPHASNDDEPEPRIWAIGPGEVECDHPPDEVRDLGLDGLNGYYQCERCGAGLVIKNEVDFWADR